MEKGSLRIVKAEQQHLPAIVELMNSSIVGARQGQETDDLAPYQKAFEGILSAPETDIYVVLAADGSVLATFQIVYIRALAFRGQLRAELENVHTRADMRGKGIGAMMVRYACDLAREQGCVLVQLTSNKVRVDAHRFYERLGFEATHLGFKLML